MPYRPPNAQPDFSRLQQYLVNSGLQQSNNALFQTIKILIQWLQDFQNEANSDISDSGADISGLVALVTQLIQANYLTSADDSGFLPNSRELLAGTGITFDDSVPNQRTIESSGGSGGTLVPLAVGAEPLEFVSDGAGQPILVDYTP